MKARIRVLYIPTLATVVCAAATGQTPLYDLTGSAGEGFGTVVESVGDVNKDGIDDIAVGEPLRNNSGGGVDHGSMKIFDGATGNLIRQTSGFDNNGQFGSAFAALGDLNGDGFDDFAVAAFNERNNSSARSGVVRIASGRTITEGVGVLYLQTIHGIESGDRFGNSLSSISDLDGDGRRELIVGAPGRNVGGTADHGQVEVYSFGGNAPIRTYSAGALSPDSSLGTAVAGMGDVNGDSVADFAAGVPGDWTNGPDAGAIFVLSGQDGSLLHSIYGQSPGDEFGAILDAGADMNGDGIDDIAVGIPKRDEPFVNQGKVLLFRGQDGFPIDSILGEDEADEFGASLSISGDVNKDGRNDLLVGAPFASINYRGTAYLYSGHNRQLMGRIEGTYSNARVGLAVELVPSLDGDGSTELVVGTRGNFAVYPGEFYSTYNYCQSQPNSVGPGASISASGSVSVAAADLTVQAEGCPPGVPGLFFFGATQLDAPFGDGSRCAGGVVKRVNPFAFTDGTGTATRLLDFGAPYGSNLLPGSSWNFQYWYRDQQGGPAGFNLTNALNATFCP